MARIGSLNEWSRFLDAKNDDEAAAELAKYARRIDAVYEHLSTVVIPLWNSPTGEVADVLMVARAAMADAAGMLESVRARYLSGEREIA